MISNSVNLHLAHCHYLNDMYKAKNGDYGDSFRDTYRKFGIVSALTRISDKYNRIVNLYNKTGTQVKDESMRDTLYDLANYCLMTIMEIDDASAEMMDKVTGQTNEKHKGASIVATVPSPTATYEIIDGVAFTRSSKTTENILNSDIPTDANMAYFPSSAQDSSDDANHGD